MSRQYISINAKFTEDGLVLPLCINWRDGRVFDIDKIDCVTRAASIKSGGAGYRYTCFVRGKQVYLFRDNNTWFIERVD